MQLWTVARDLLRGPPIARGIPDVEEYCWKEFWSFGTWHAWNIKYFLFPPPPFFGPQTTNTRFLFCFVFVLGTNTEVGDEPITVLAMCFEEGLGGGGEHFQRQLIRKGGNSAFLQSTVRAWKGKGLNDTARNYRLCLNCPPEHICMGGSLVSSSGCIFPLFGWAVTGLCAACIISRTDVVKCTIRGGDSELSLCPSTYCFPVFGGQVEGRKNLKATECVGPPGWGAVKKFQGRCTSCGHLWVWLWPLPQCQGWSPLGWGLILVLKISSEVECSGYQETQQRLWLSKGFPTSLWLFSSLFTRLLPLLLSFSFYFSSLRMWTDHLLLKEEWVLATNSYLPQS